MHYYLRWHATNDNLVEPVNKLQHFRYFFKFKKSVSIVTADSPAASSIQIS